MSVVASSSDIGVSANNARTSADAASTSGSAACAPSREMIVSIFASSPVSTQWRR